MNTYNRNMAAVTKQEVKTIYHIMIGVNEMTAILEEANGQDPELMKALEAFQFDLNNYATGRQGIIQLLKDLWRPNGSASETNTISYIVREIIGFDGIENYGYFDEKTNKVSMVVYSYGDRIN